MDSPERNQIVTSTTSSASPQVQDSPFFNYASSLSPIKPVKGIRSAQGFSELSFPPPPVFTSPRINALRETGFLKRSTCPRSSTTELSLEQGSRDKIVISGSLASEPSTMQSVVGFIPGSQKVHNNKGPVQVKSCSPSGSVDEYLADPVEMEDCANSTNLADLSIMQVRDQTEAAVSVCTSSKETTMKLDDDGPPKVLDAVVVASLALERVEEDLLPKSLIPVKSVDSECMQKTYELTSTKCIDIISEKANDFVEPDPSLEPVSGAQQCLHLEADLATKDFPFLSKKKEHDSVYSGEEKPARSRILIRYGSRAVKLPSVEDRMQDKLDSTTHLLPDYLPTIQAYENHKENSGAKSKGSVEDRILYDSEEGSQYQRGTLRRCLQFEAAEGQGNTNLNSQNSWNSQTDVLLNSSSPQSPEDLEIMHSSHQKSRLTSSNKQAVNFSQPFTSRSPICQVEMPEIDKSVRNSVSSSVISPMPSGIGLHLNSIVNAAATGYDATANMKFIERGCSNVHSEKPPSVYYCSIPGDSKSSPISTSLVENFSNYDDNQQESLPIVTTRSATFQSSQDLQCISKSLQLELIEYNTTPLDKEKSSSESADRFEEFNQPFSQKKRKRTSTIENDGCKRCNCKKSKCLKLYCECFAAGVYCSEPCSCLDCYNKPEHEDTVLGTRQQIESRNPLAFAPKIVKRVDESPVNSVEEGNRMTPASARHKRGCNCKKSMCLKKYCECYQAGVGCSDGCRCEGCKNTFGIKEGYGESRDLHTKADSERWEDSSDDKMRDMAKIKIDQLYPEQHPQKLSPLTPLFQSSNHGKDANKSRIIVRRYVPSPESDRPKTGERTLDIACYDPESECSSGGRVDQISQRQDEHVDVYDQTPLPHGPSKIMASSSSSNSRGVIKVSRAHGLQGNVCLSSVAPLRWLGSPITPLPQLGESKIPHDPDSDSRLYEILEDDTPDILKETHTPIKAFKASSPNQKRVSPPHNHMQELRSTCSPSLKSGRKFVLRSISAFPPLTPHSDPKVGSSDK